MAGQAAAKPATQVDAGDPITVTEPAGPDYASRGGHKLAGALAAFGELRVAGRRCLDAGASTGGFTDVLLRAGAATSSRWTWDTASWHGRCGPTSGSPCWTGSTSASCGPNRSPPHRTWSRPTFPSSRWTWCCPRLSPAQRPEADFLLLVKPQFEVGKDRVGAGGVVRDPDLRRDAVAGVAEAARAHGLGVAGVTASPLPGPSGNVEYFLWLRRGAPPLRDNALRQAIEEGPQ